MIFTPKKNIYFPNRNWGMKKYQRGMLHPVGFWHDTGGGGAYDETLTVGDDVWFEVGTEDQYFAWGYNGATQDPLSLASFGSISTGYTYTDGGSNTRTITGVYYSEDTGLSAAYDDSIFFGLNGSSISDSDTTFVDIEYNGQTLTRSSAHDYITVTTVSTWWQWQPVTNGPTTGTASIIVNI